MSFPWAHNKIRVPASDPVPSFDHPPYADNWSSYKTVVVTGRLRREGSETRDQALKRLCERWPRTTHVFLSRGEWYVGYVYE